MRFIDRGPQHCAIHSAGVHCDVDCSGRLRAHMPAVADAPHTYHAPVDNQPVHHMAHVCSTDTGLPGNVPILGAVRYADSELAAVRSPDELSEDRTNLEELDESSSEVGPADTTEMDEAAARAQAMVDAERAMTPELERAIAEGRAHVVRVKP